MSNVLEFHPLHSNSRPDVSEAQVKSQDRTLAVLLEQAFRIKEEVAASLQRSQGCVHSQTLSRKLLESHILTITCIVKELSLNVQTLERQIAQRDSAACGTTQAVQWLDRKNMAGIGDLRGRVARCDSSIASLSAEVNSSERQVIRLQQEVTQLRSAMDTKMKALEVKLQRDLGRVEASLAEVYQIHRSLIMDMQNQTGKIEKQMSAKIMMEATKQSNLLKKCAEQQIHDTIQINEHRNQLLQDKMKETECGLLGRLHGLETRLDQLETHQEELSLSGWAEQFKRMEANISKRVSSLEHSLHRELQLLKQNYHKGFRCVHDAIDSLKEIADLKYLLDKGKIKKEINHICSKVAELSDA